MWTIYLELRIVELGSVRGTSFRARPRLQIRDLPVGDDPMSDLEASPMLDINIAVLGQLSA